MAQLGNVVGNCAENETVRTRVGDCDVMPGKIVGLLITRRGKTFPSDPAAFAAALEDNILKGDIVPLMGLEIPAVAGFDIASTTPDGGGLRYVGLNPPQFDYPLTGAGICKVKALASLDLKYMSYMWLCQDGADFRLWAATKLDAEGKEVIYGFEGQSLRSYTMPTGTDSFVMHFNVSHGTMFGMEFDSASTFIVKNTTILDGLMAITLLPGTTAGTARIVAACSGQDVGTDIAEMLDGDATDMFENTTTNASPTSATIDPATGIVTIAPAGTYRIVNAVALDAIGIVGFDGLKEGAVIAGA